MSFNIDNNIANHEKFHVKMLYVLRILKLRDRILLRSIKRAYIHFLY